MDGVPEQAEQSKVEGLRLTADDAGEAGNIVSKSAGLSGT
jgi:hypothetical protein